MGKFAVDERYRCPDADCQIDHEDRDDAARCCWRPDDKVEEITKYECTGGCGAMWDTRREAVACCNEPSAMYSCPYCGESWNDLNDALDCCKEQADSTTEFRCKDCDTVYEDKEEAHACCSPVIDVKMFRCINCGDRYDNAAEAIGCC